MFTFRFSRLLRLLGAVLFPLTIVLAVLVAYQGGVIQAQHDAISYLISITNGCGHGFGMSTI